MPWGEEQEEQEALGYGSETRLVILSYATGDFAFEILEGIKTFWAKGELLKFHYKVKNNGTVKSSATIEIYDNTTNELLGKWTISALDPNYSFEAFEATINLLKMPDHDWTLRFELTP